MEGDDGGLSQIYGEKAWKVVIRGWKHQVITYEDGTTTLKPEVEWIDAEDEEVIGNSTAFSSIFNGMDKNMFILIKTWSEAKEAWEILKIAYESTPKVHMSRM